MGYRSEVAYVINFEDKQKLNEFIAKVMVLGGDVANALKECEIEVVEGAFHCYRINFYQADVKWYDSYADVTFIEGMYKDFTKTLGDTPDYNYEYIRIGEEILDIEERCGQDGFNHICVARSIEHF